MATKRSFSNAVKWSYIATWGEKAFSALFTVVLAAILGPREFGVISIALIYIGFLNMFQDQGLVAALIQKKDLEHEHSDAVFWMNQVLSFVLVGISIALSGWWAARNHAPEVATFISVLSLSIPIEGLTIVQAALLKREMDFRSLSIRSNISVVAGGVVGLGMAFVGFRAWALVGQLFARDIVALALLWKLSHWRPRFEFSWKHLKELLGFSVSNFAAQLGMFADVQASSVILGLLFGPIAVGLYRIADRVANTVVIMAMASVQSVALPEFSRLQRQPDELRKSALACVRLTSVMTLPALAGLAAVSGPLMATIGPQWIPASGVLKLISVLGVAIIFAFFTGPLLQALGKSRQLALLEWARTILGVAGLVVAGILVRNSTVIWQLTGIALSRFVTGGFIVAPVFVYILMRLSGISLRELVESIAPSAIAACSVVGAVFLFQFSGLLAQERPLVLLIVEVAIGGAVGLTVLLSLETQLRTFALGFLQRSFRHRVPSEEVV